MCFSSLIERAMKCEMSLLPYPSFGTVLSLGNVFLHLIHLQLVREIPDKQLLWVRCRRRESRVDCKTLLSLSFSFWLHFRLGWPQNCTASCWFWGRLLNHSAANNCKSRTISTKYSQVCHHYIEINDSIRDFLDWRGSECNLLLRLCKARRLQRGKGEKNKIKQQKAWMSWFLSP